MRARHSVFAFALSSFVTWSLPTSAQLNVALEDYSTTSPCQGSPGEVYDAVASMLVARGHTVSKVTATALDTPAEILSFDVVVFGGEAFTCEWDWAGFDAQLPGYVNAGGGLVVTGWAAYYMDNNTKNDVYPGLESVLPVLKGQNYPSGVALTVLPGHPITSGIGNFTSPDYVDLGGGIKPGAASLLSYGSASAGSAWSQGQGRAVYLAPIYLANWANYNNETLLNGTLASARLLFIQAVEWAGGIQTCSVAADCTDGNACNGAEACTAGKCASGTPPTCDDNNPCTTDSCAPATGCVHASISGPCDDGDACTQSDQCTAGSCVGSNPVVCTALDTCHDPGACDPATGTCSNPPKPDGTSCDDGNACLENEQCASGVCSGSIVACPPDECHVAVACDPAVGCANPPKADGTPCSLGECISGVCTAVADGGTGGATTGGSGGTGGTSAGGTSAGGTSAGGTSTGGTSTGGAGSGGTNTDGGIGPGGSSSSGCGCRLAGSHSSAGALLSILGLALFLVRRRRSRVA